MMPVTRFSAFPVAAALGSLFMTLACSSAQPLPQGIREPEVALAQVFAGEGLFQRPGQVSVPFVIQVTNTSEVPITLERVQLRSIGAGSYEVSQTIGVGRQEIAPGETRQISFSAWVVSSGGAMNAAVPTTVRAIAHFDSSRGKFRSVFTETLGGMGGNVG